jgi:hypothetical protein
MEANALFRLPHCSISRVATSFRLVSSRSYATPQLVLNRVSMGKFVLLFV